MKVQTDGPAVDVAIEVQQVGLDARGRAVKRRRGADTNGRRVCPVGQMGLTRVHARTGHELPRTFGVGRGKPEPDAASRPCADSPHERVWPPEAQLGAMHAAAFEQCANQGAGNEDRLMVFDLQADGFNRKRLEAALLAELPQQLGGAFASASEAEGRPFHHVRWMKPWHDDPVDEVLGREAQQGRRAVRDGDDIGAGAGELGDFLFRQRESRGGLTRFHNAERVRLEGEYRDGDAAVGGEEPGLGDDLPVPAVHAVEIADGQNRGRQFEALEFLSSDDTHAVISRRDCHTGGRASKIGGGDSFGKHPSSIADWGLRRGRGHKGTKPRRGMRNRALLPIPARREDRDKRAGHAIDD